MIVWKIRSKRLNRDNPSSYETSLFYDKLIEKWLYILSGLIKQNDLKMILKKIESRSKMIEKWSKNWLNVFSGLFDQNDRKIIKKLIEYVFRAVRTKWSKKDRKMYWICFQGCSNKMISFVEDHVIYLIAVAGGVAVIQVKQNK